MRASPRSWWRWCSSIGLLRSSSTAASSTTRSARRGASGRRSAPSPELARRRLDHVLEAAQADARRVDQHRHVAGLVLVLPHHLMGERDLVPGKHLAHARIDTLVEHELVGGARLLEMREMRALHALLP